MSTGGDAESVCYVCMLRHSANMSCGTAARVAMSNHQKQAAAACVREPRGPCGEHERCILRGGHLEYCRGINGERIAPKREGTKFVPLPDGAGEFKAATVFNGVLFIACDNGAYYRSKEGTWQELKL